MATPITTKKEIFFSDFDWAFTAHPKTGDITILTNETAVKRALRNYVLTKFSERRFYSNKGCGLYFNIFEPLDIISSMSIQNSIKTAIDNFEPRVQLINVEVYEDETINNGITVTIYFQIINSIQIETVDIFLERTR